MEKNEAVEYAVKEITEYNDAAYKYQKGAKRAFEMCKHDYDPKGKRLKEHNEKAKDIKDKIDGEIRGKVLNNSCPFQDFSLIRVKRGLSLKTPYRLALKSDVRLAICIKNIRDSFYFTDKNTFFKLDPAFEKIIETKKEIEARIKKPKIKRLVA